MAPPEDIDGSPLHAGETTCYICHEGDTVPVSKGCACRGGTRWVHPDCAVTLAVASNEVRGVTSWTTCDICKWPMTGELALVLANELETRTADLDPLSPPRLVATLSRATCLVSSGRFQEAVPVLRDLTDAVADNSVASVQIARLLISALRSNGELDAAEAAAERAIAAATAHQDAILPADMGHLRMALADVRLRRGESAAASQAYRDVMRGVRPPGDKDGSCEHLCFLQAQWRWGLEASEAPTAPEREQGRAAVAAAVASMERIAGPDHPDVRMMRAAALI